MKPRLLFADDDKSILQMLAYVSKSAWGFEVVAEASASEEAVDYCVRLQPSVVIADLRMPTTGGIGLLREVRKRKLNVGVVFFTAALDQTALKPAIKAKPDGFVLKSDHLTELRDVIESVSRGAPLWTTGAEEIRRTQCYPSVHNCESDPLRALTHSELVVLRMVAEGMSTKEIAVSLEKSASTVAHQRQSIMDKVKVHSAVALTSVARRAGLID